MSDPVSNAEIEDVLSSIRRLVSADKRFESHVAEPRHGASGPSTSTQSADAEDPAPEPQGAAGPGEARLVLTPSFRVRPEEEDVTANPAGDDAEHLALEQWQVTPDSTVEAAGSDTGEVDDLSAEAWDNHSEDDSLGGETAEPWPEADDDVMTALHDDMRADDDAHLKDWLTAEDTAEDTSDESADDWQDDTLPDHGDAQSGADFETAAFVDDDVAFDYTDPDVPEDATGSLEREPKTSELEARIAEVEAAVAAREDQWEPDGASEDAYAGGRTEPLPWEDHVETATPVFIPRAAHHDTPESSQDDAQDEMPSPDTSASGESKAPGGADGSFGEGQAEQGADTARGAEAWYREDTDAVLDEDALRDLVSEIVRQELQGTLGERITRNVRKLVRREIHRALMGQELE